MHLEHLESLLNEVAQVGGLALAVVDLVADILVSDLEQVKHGQDLSVVGHEGLTNGVGARHERLQDLQSDRDNLNVTGVQSD